MALTNHTHHMRLWGKIFCGAQALEGLRGEGNYRETHVF